MPFSAKKYENIDRVSIYLNTLQIYFQRLKPDIALFYRPYFSFIASKLKKQGTKIVYDCVDDFSAFPDAKRSRVMQEEWKLVSQSDLIVVTSKRLLEKMTRIKCTASLIPNAVNYKHFTKKTTVPYDIKTIPHPIIGYFGAISEWFDEKLVCDMAARRPDWSFVIIGPRNKAIRFSKLPNVFLLGRKLWLYLPAYLNQFDVSIIPFKVNELTLSVNPIKVYEYLAGGKPVVSVDLPELRNIPFVKIARDAEEFVGKIEEALKESGRTALINARKEYASHNTWDVRVDELLTHIRQLSNSS